MKKPIIIVLVLAIIIILIILATKGNNKDASVEIVPQTSQNEAPSLPNNPPTQSESTDTASDTATTTHTVSYSSTGFSPSSITIKAGDTVTFTNGTSSKMWVASDPHPQHTDFSDFDAGKGYEAGTSYSYTFNTAGTYTYHDHLHASMRGTVIVE